MSELTDALLRYGTAAKLLPGQDLVRQGDASDGLYYVESGLLRAYKEQAGAELYPLSLIRAGSLVGEIGSITGSRRTATVRAELDSVVIHVPERALRRALAERPTLARDLVREVGARLVGADEARVSLGRSYESVSARAGALRAEKARLEEEIALREELTDMIVHDLRNPLAVVASGLQLLELIPGESPDTVTREVFESLGRSVRRMQRLIDTLLDVARSEGGDLALDLAEVDPAGLIEETVREERALAEGQGVALVAAAADGAPRVTADPDLVCRVLVNLVDNALKATPAGGRVTLAARAETDPMQGAWVRFDVSDTGPGIPPEAREHVFEKFAQLPGEGTGRRGSGLGLTFCRMAVEAHGGRIWVDEGPGGVGACFSFRLPHGAPRARV